MKTVVLCFAHKDPALINILIDQFNAEAKGDIDIFFHVDKKNESIISAISKYDNVHYIKNNIEVTWGDDSMLRALILSLREIIEHNVDYDHAIICTGQDLIVRKGLFSFLDENGDSIYLDTWKEDEYIRGLLLYPMPKCFRKYFKTRFGLHMYVKWIIAVRKGLIPQKKLRINTDDLDLWTSYNWSAMPYYVWKWILDFVDNNADFMEIYKNTRVPEDGFLGTMVMNSPYRKNVVFEEGKKRSKSLTFLKELEREHFQAIKREDIETIDKTQCYMARKFDEKIDGDVIEYFRKKILGGR